MLSGLRFVYIKVGGKNLLAKCNLDTHDKVAEIHLLMLDMGILLNNKGKGMTNKAQLFLFCGKMGAGKSTYSQGIAKQKQAVLLSEDAWLEAHYPQQITTFNDYIHYSSLIKPFVKQHVQQLLSLGLNVVMDFPANTVKQRNWLVSLANEVQCKHTLFYLQVSDEVCLLQIAKRRLAQPERAHFDTPEVFHQVTRYFEPPTASEQLEVEYVTESNS